MINPERAITPTVAGVAQIPANLPHLRFPMEWFNHVTLPGGKPAMNAMAILADTIFWYQPKEVIDPRTNQVVGYERKFSGDLLQRSYRDYEQIFGFTIDQSRYALDILEGLNVLHRVVRAKVDVTLADGTTKTLSNVMYLDINVQRLYEITVPQSLRLAYPMGGGLGYIPEGLVSIPEGSGIYTRHIQSIHIQNSITNAPDGGLTEIPESQSGTATATFTLPGLPGIQNRRLLAIQLRLDEAAKVGLNAVTLREAAEVLAEVNGVTALIDSDDAEYGRQQDMAIQLAGMGIKTPEQIQKLYHSWSTEDGIGRKETANGALKKAPKGNQIVKHASWLKQEGRLNDGNITPLPDIAGNDAGGNSSKTYHRNNNATGRPTGKRGELTEAVTRKRNPEEIEALARELQERLALDDA